MSITKKTTQKSNLWITIPLLVLASLLIASYLLKGQLVPEVTAKLNTSCDLRKNMCSVELPGGGKTLFSITPNTIPVMKPLSLKVLTEGITATSVEVVFVGVGMDMGYNHTRLHAETSNLFKGEIIIPICTQSRMEWEARVLLNTSRGQIVAPFRFYSQK